MTEGMYEQSIIVEDAVIQSALDLVDELVRNAVEERSDAPLINFARGIRKTVHISGVALAKLLYSWKRVTQRFGISREDFEDHVYNAIGISHQAIRKYSDMWEQVAVRSNLPPDKLCKILSKPIQGLLLLPAAIKEGQMTPEAWERIERAPDPASMRLVVRELRGQVTSSVNAIVITWQRDGVLVARRGDEYMEFGYLNHDSGSDLANAAIARLINAAGIVEV